MNTKIVLSLTVIMLLTLACGLSAPVTPPSNQPDVATIVAQTVQASISNSNAPATALPATPIPPTNTQAVVATQDTGQLTPNGTLFNSTEVSFFIPNGVANDATSAMTSNVEYPYINPSLGDMPRHVTVKLNLYPVSGAVFSPQIMIFHADEYSQYSEKTAATIAALKGLQYADGQSLPEALTSDFTAQIHAVNFKNGHGVRYLTQVFQNFLPVNNKDLFYYYQGMTSDGKYFVQATLPINAAFLPADDNPNTPLPADGIAFNMDDFQGYLNSVTQKLNTTETYNFNPYLDALDEMMASMQVAGF
jgi:hypothetical protein